MTYPHYKPRMIQSMYVESNKDFLVNDIPMITPANSRTSVSTTAIPRPYKNVETQNSVSILSKTQTYLQEKKRRSQSQPPEKRVKQKFEFLSTSNYLAMQSDISKNDHNNKLG